NPNQVGQVSLSSWWVEAPEEALSRIGAELDLKALEIIKGKGSSTGSLLTAEEFSVTLQTLQNTAGVNVLTAPGITTADGRAASISATSQQIVAGQEHTLGPSLDVEPRIAEDGSVSLSASARYRRRNPAVQ